MKLSIRSFISKRRKLLSNCASVFASVFLFSAAAGIALYYIWGPGPGYFHADCTDSLLWANASVESGRVFDETYRYAALLPFSAVMWFIPLIKIFGLGMTAQNLGMSIFVLLFCASIWFLCRSSGFGKVWSSTAVFFTTLVLSSSDKLREIMYGHTIYYSVSLLIIFTLSGLFLSAMKTVEKKRFSVGFVIFSLLIMFMCAGTATDGGQVIVIGSLPVIAGFMAERLFCGEDRLFCRKNRAGLVILLSAVIGTAIGIFLLAGWRGENVSASYADAYSGWSAISAWSDNARLFFKQYLTLIGVVEGKESLFSKDSVFSLLRIFVGLMILVIPLVMLVLYRFIKSAGTKIILWAHFVVSAAIMVGFICGKLSGANWRLTPMVGTAAMTSVMGLREFCVYGLEKLRSAKDVSVKETSAGETPYSGADVYPSAAETLFAGAYDEPAAAPSVDYAAEGTASSVATGRVIVRFGAILTAVALLFPCLVFLEIKKMPADYGRDNYKFALAEFLVEKNLKYGYATFWNSQAITVLSDSKTLCREVLATAGDGVYTDFYQSSRNWYKNLDYDNYYVLLSNSEYSKVCNTDSWESWVKDCFVASYSENDGVYPGFVIYVFSENVCEIEE